MSRFLLPKCSGRPRYFPMPPSCPVPRADLTFCFVLGSVLEEKVIADLLRLMHWPEASSYLCKIDTRASQLARSERQKNMVSSAKRRWFIGGQARATFTPPKAPLSCAWLQSPDSTSVHRMKRYGERGSPGLSPRVGETSP